MNGRQWTTDEDATLTRLYHDHCAKEIGAVLGRSKKGIYARARLLGLHSDIEHIRHIGHINSQHPKSIATRFTKGHSPMNKGKHHSPEVYAKVAKTMFKKGHRPHNSLPVGTEVLRDDGYIWVKIADPDKWVQKQRAVWMQHHGEIPKGYNVQFRNKDRTDFRIDNLYIISRADQMRNENSLIASYPKPLADIIRLKGVVNRQIHKAEKKNGK